MSSLAIALSALSCTAQNNPEIPVRFKFRSQRYYEDILKCKGIGDLIEMRKLQPLHSSKEPPLGETLINSAGTERLIININYDGTDVVFKAAEKLPDNVINAAKACGN